MNKDNGNNGNGNANGNADGNADGNANGNADGNASANANANSMSAKIVVDRTVHAKLPSSIDRGAPSQPLPSPTSTPSADDGIPPSLERIHRLHGTSILLDAATLLRLPPSAYATSCAIFHRAYHRVSLKQHCVWSVALGCALLAGKVEEEPRTVRAIVLTFAHLYRRRRLRVGDDVHRYSYGAADCEADAAAALTDAEKENMLRSVQPMAPGGKVYAAWSEALLHAEHVILRNLGFTLHWIPDSHPHKFILYFVRVLGINREEVAQQAWDYCNDSCQLELCVQFDPEVIACAAILMATSDHNIELPLVPCAWWESFVGSNRNDELSIVCNSIFAAGDETDLDVRRAKYAFVPSAMANPSFNDPDSYLWSVAD